MNGIKTPSARAVAFAKNHGRPMDATVILAWEAGWNAAQRDRGRLAARIRLTRGKLRMNRSTARTLTKVLNSHDLRKKSSRSAPS